MIEGNVEKTMTAPVVAIIGFDTHFFEKVPQLFPHKPEAAEWFKDDVNEGSPLAFRNGTLQGAYFMIAARAIGLDCGPMSGFDNAGVDKDFFPDGKVKSNFICNIGYGDPAGVFERLPRLPFEDACELL
ncbi:MAG: malonic semialdehyde reductase, partial [Pseudomonadota bacterium]